MKRYMKLYKENEQSDLDTYIDKSSFWEKKNTILEARSGKNIRWVFAENPDMKAIICLFRGWFIITTESSHKNIMNYIEGKLFAHEPPRSQEEPTIEELDEFLYEIDIEIDELLTAVPDYH